MGEVNLCTTPQWIVVLTLFLTLIPPTMGQSNCVFPEGGVSVGVLFGACCAVLAGTLLFELVGYLAYQKWKKKRLKSNADEPSVSYSSSKAVDIEANDDKGQPKEGSVRRGSSNDSGRGSVFTISDSLDSPSLFDDSVHGSKSNSMLDVANDFNPLKETYRIDWKLSSDDLNITDDYDVLEKAFPVSLPKLDTIDFTSARYKSSEIKLVPDPQEIIVGVAVEGEHNSEKKASSSSRTFTSTSHVGATSTSLASRQDGRHQRLQRSSRVNRFSEDIPIEIIPDRPRAPLETRIEIDENFSIASTRRSESSDEDLYDYGDSERRVGTGVAQQSRSLQSHRTSSVDHKSTVSRHDAEDRSHDMNGSAAMKASGAQKAKVLGDEKRASSRFTQSTKSPARGSRHDVGNDYHITRREVVNGQEFVTLVRAGRSSSTKSVRDQARSKSTRYLSRNSTTIPRSPSETNVDPRSKVSFRDPLESASDTNSIPTIGVIHLVDTIHEEPDAALPRPSSGGSRGRTKERYQRKHYQRSRSLSPIKYSEKNQSESQEPQERGSSRSSNTSEAQSRSKSTIQSGKTSESGGRRFNTSNVPTIGLVRLASSSPHDRQKAAEISSASSVSRWPRSRESSSPIMQPASAEMYQPNFESHVTAHHSYVKPVTAESKFLRMIDVSTQVYRPKSRTTATEPLVPWSRLLGEMEEILARDMNSVGRKSKVDKKKSTLSRLTSYRKGKKEGKVTPDGDDKKLSGRSANGSDVNSWDGRFQSLQAESDSIDERYFSEPERENINIYRSASAHGRGSSSTYSKRRSQSVRRNTGESNIAHRSRSVSPSKRSISSGKANALVKNTFTEPEVSWETLLQNVRARIRAEDGRRGRSPVRRSRSERDWFHRLADKGTQSDVSWNTLLRLMEARIEEKVTKEQRYKKRSAPLVGKFSLKAERRPQKSVADMGTSPELNWSEVIDIATSEAENNMKSKSVPDLRRELEPQNIGVFSLTGGKEMAVPVRSTGTETDLSFSDLVDIILQEIKMVENDTSSQRSKSYDQQMVIDRVRSLGIVQVRSKSEERLRGRDSGTQPDLSWAQLIDIVTEEAHAMLLRQRKEMSSEMGTDPIIAWRQLVETIHEESGEFWSRRKRQSNIERYTEPELSWQQLVTVIQEECSLANKKHTTNRGIQPRWSWSDIVDIIQNETEEILYLKKLKNMVTKSTSANFVAPTTSQETQTYNEGTSVAVSTLRTWIRDRPRRVQWEDATEPEKEWDKLVKEIEGAAIDDYITAHGLDQPREAPVVGVFKLKKERVEKSKIKTTESATGPLLDWGSFINELQEDAVESFKKISKQKSENQNTSQRVPVAGMFKLKQEKAQIEKQDTGTNPEVSWKNITEDIEMNAIESYRRTMRPENPASMGVLKLKAAPKKEKDETFTQSDETWSDIVTDLRQEFENEYRKTIRELQTKVSDLEEIPKSLGVLTLKSPESPKLVDIGTQPDWGWDVIINTLQEETEKSVLRHQRRQRQKQLDSMLTTSVQADVETVDAGIGDDPISNEHNFVEVRNASSQVMVRLQDKACETRSSVLESGVQVEVRTNEMGVSASQSTAEIGNDAIIFRMPSIGITCAPNVVETGVTVCEQKREVMTTAVQATPHHNTVSVETVQTHLEEKTTQCKHAMKDVSVSASRETTDGCQQTSIEVAHESLMVDIKPAVREEGIQIISDSMSQLSQTEIRTCESSVMTDPMGEFQEDLILAEVEEKSEASYAKNPVEQEVQTFRDTYETWTFTDIPKFTDQESEVYITEFDDYDVKKVVETSTFSQQIGNANTNDISILASPDTSSLSTETDVREMKSKQVQAAVDSVSRGSIASTESKDAPTQTSLIDQTNFSGSCVPSMVEKSIQSNKEMAEFSQYTRFSSCDRECQVTPDAPKCNDSSSMAKPEMHTLGTEYYISDEDSDTDSGIDIHCQTHPVLIFSLEEYQQIEREMNEYRQMQQNMEELKVRLKEFEEMALLKEHLELVDVGLETEELKVECDATQTLIPVHAESTQTFILDFIDRSSSPIPSEVRDIISQTVPIPTKDISTEMDDITCQSQSAQTTSDSINKMTETEYIEKYSSAIQATVQSQQVSCQHDRSQENIGVQAEINTETLTQGSQVDFNVRNSATSTETLQQDSSTQSSHTVRDNHSQYEITEQNRGSQTIAKQLVESSTETQAEFVEKVFADLKDAAVNTENVKSVTTTVTQTDVAVKDNFSQVEKGECNSMTQTDQVALKDEMLDPIVVETADTYAQAEERAKMSDCKFTQTETQEKFVKDATTSHDIDVNHTQVQTIHLMKESTSSQVQPEICSSITQTDEEKIAKVVDSSTWMNLSYQSFSGQTDSPSRMSQGVQRDLELCTIGSQTNSLKTSENAVNTIPTESIESSSQTLKTEEVEIKTKESEVQHTVKAGDSSIQTDHMPTKSSFTATEEITLSDQMVGTDQVSLKDTGSQAAVSVSAQLTQSEISLRTIESQTRLMTTAESSTSVESMVTMDDSFTQCEVSLGAAIETQTELLSMSDACTSYERSTHNDSTTQYEGYVDDRGIQTEPPSVERKHTLTDPPPVTIGETQTDEIKKIYVDHEAQTLTKRNEFGVTVKTEITDVGVQVQTKTKDETLSCDFQETEYIPIEKEVTTVEASVLQQQSTCSFQSQFDEPKMTHEEVATTVKPNICVTGNQISPETSIFTATAVPQTADAGTSFDVKNQCEISSQATPKSDSTFTQMELSMTERSLSPIPIATITASTQISLKPVHTATLQIQVNEDSETYTGETTKVNRISVVDAVTQTKVVNSITATQTVSEANTVEIPRRSDAVVDVRQNIRQSSMEFHPVQHSRGTATYNSLRKEMGTQFITREVVRKAHSRRDVLLTSEGTFTDMTTRTTSSTQTMRTPVAHSSAQVMPTMSSVAVFSDIRPHTVSEGVNTKPKMVRDVPVQIEYPEKRVEMLIEKHISPVTRHAASPNMMEKMEKELIVKMKSELRSQVRKEVQAEYATEILPGLLEKALAEKLDEVKRSRPKSRDAVTSPLRGRSVERSFQHSESWPFSSTDAPDQNYLTEKELNVLKENTRRELKHELKEEVKKEIEKEVRIELAREVEEDVRQQVAKDVEANVRSLIEEYVRDDVIKELKEELRESVKREVAFEVRGDVKKEVALEVRHEVKREIGEEVRDEVKLRVRGEIKESVEEALRKELKPLVTRDLKDELKDDVISELKNELTSEIKDELTEKLEGEIKEKLTERYKREVYKREEQKIKSEIEQSVRNEIEPLLREEIEKELREDITHELKIANLALVTSQKAVVVDKGTSVYKIKVRSIPTQVERPTHDEGVQVNNTGPQTVEKISQTQPTVMERGTTTQTRLLKEFTIQIEPVVSETGTSPVVHFSTKTFALQTDSPTIDKKHRADQYVYIPPRIEEGTQSAVINAITSTSIQATPQRDEKSVFHNYLKSNSSTSTTHGTDTNMERKNQGVQAHRPPVSGRPAQVQTSDDFGRTSSSMQFQPFTTEASTGFTTALQQISKESQTARRVRDVPIQFESKAFYKETSTSPERLTDTSDRYVQIEPVMRDEASSPVLFQNYEKAINVRNEEGQVSSIHIESAVRDNHGKKLSPIVEEPVKLKKNPKLSDVDTARIDEELYNLFQQVERLGPVSRAPSGSSTTNVSSVLTKVPSDIITTIMQRFPPKCEVMILQQSTPDATYTTAVLSASSVRPTMSTGYQQNSSTWSRGVYSAARPLLVGSKREQFKSSTSNGKTDKSVEQSGKGTGTKIFRNGKASSVRFADEDDLLKKDKGGKEDYSYLSKVTSIRRTEPVPVSKKFLDLESRSSKGITTRLSELYGASPPEKDNNTPEGFKGGMEGDVDTGDSETDAEHLKSILRVRKTTSGAHKQLGRRALADYRDETTTDSDGSSVCDQYDISGASAKAGSTAFTVTAVPAAKGDKGQIKQDLSMSGVIESNSKTFLTGYRSFDSSRKQPAVTGKKYTTYSGHQKPERDLN